MDQFYEEEGSLFVEAYDAFYPGSGPQIAGVVGFYERVARQVGGPVLELACGTGRIALPLAKAGLYVTGVDRSEAMLTIARRASCLGAGTSSLDQAGHERAESGSAFWFRLRARSFLPAPVDDRSTKKIIGGHSPPSAAERPAGPSLIRSSSRFSDRREHPTAGAFRHPS